jgi:hypothetical protein
MVFMSHLSIDHDLRPSYPRVHRPVHTANARTDVDRIEPGENGQRSQ